MTPGEFKAWFDGFCEAFDKAPTQKQWARIKERVAEIDGKPVTERVFVDRYLPQYIPYLPRPTYWQGYWPYYSSNTGSVSGGMGSASNVLNETEWRKLYQGAQQSGLNSSYNSVNAMNSLGRAEAQALTQ